MGERDRGPGVDVCNLTTLGTVQAPDGDWGVDERKHLPPIKKLRRKEMGYVGKNENTRRRRMHLSQGKIARRSHKGRHHPRRAKPISRGVKEGNSCGKRLDEVVIGHVISEKRKSAAKKDRCNNIGNWMSKNNQNPPRKTTGVIGRLKKNREFCEQLHRRQAGKHAAQRTGYRMNKA